MAERSRSGDGRRNDFSTTHWSVVLAAGNDNLDRAPLALERLCRKYWYPIYAFIRRRGSEWHEAEDLTQAFFTHLLEKETLKKVNRQKGRFRSFLLAAVTNFLANEWDKKQTLKRGGQKQIVSLDEMEAEELYSHEPAGTLTPEKLFERRWALTLVDQVLVRLKEEYIAADKEKLFAKLEPGLTGEINPGLYTEWAAALDMSEGAVRVAVHRFRRRFGELLRNEIAHTVTTSAEVDEEIRHLFAAIAN